MMRSLAAVVLFALLLALGPWPAATAEDSGPSAAACLVCKDEHTATCPTCTGKMRVLVDCAACDGKGRSRCPVRARTIDSGSAATEKLLGHDGTQRACPNRFCTDGTIRWEGGEKSAQCKLCVGTGKIRCADCQASGSACGACAGKGRVESPCLDCGGDGKLPCILCSDRYPKCQQCEGRTKITCPQFDGVKTGPGPCTECAGRGTQICSKCSGAMKAACDGCDATGRQRMVFKDGTAASSTKCKSCDARGVNPCAQCTKGFEACAQCGGSKVEEQTCRVCSGTTAIQCRACGPAGFFAAEALAVQFSKQEASPDAKRTAIELFRKALERAQRPQRTAQEIAEMSASGPKIPAFPGAGADRAALERFSSELRAYTKHTYQQVRRIREMTAVLEAAKACAQRCEKALARLAPAEKK